MTHIQTREQAPRLAMPMRPATHRAVGGVTLTPGDFAKVLRRRKWIILLSFLLLTAASVAGSVLWAKYAPIYTASAYVRLVPPAVTVMGVGPSQNVDVLDRFRRGQAGLVKSPAVFEKALGTPELQRTGWYKKHATADLKLAMRALDEDIDVSLPAESEFVRIMMSRATANREEIQELPTIVNQVAVTFVNETNEAINYQRTATIRQFEGQLGTTGTKITEIENRINQQVELLQVPALRNQVNALTLTLQEQTRQIAQAEMQRAQVESALRALQTMQEQGTLESAPEVLQAVEMDRTLLSLLANQMQLQTELEHASEVGGPEHRSVKNIETRLTSLEENIKVRREALIASTLSALKSTREAELAGLSNALLLARDRYQQSVAALKDLESKLVTIDNLTVEKQDLEQQRRQLETRLTDLRTTLNAPEGMPALLRERAREPLEYSWPRYSVLIPLGAVLGLALGVGLALVIELIDTSVKTSTDVTRRLDMPMLAMVPHADDLDEEIADVRLAAQSSPQSLISEAYRELRTNLAFSGPAEKRRTLLVTSPSPEDGRTSVAVNLALSIASNGRRVLLVDGNFRRPGVNVLFPNAGQEGFSNVLSGQKPWRGCVSQTAVPNLQVMSSGPMPPNPTELLGSELARATIDEMAEEYEQVIFDGPPLLLVSDASVLATLVDGVVLVVRAGVNTYGIVARCRDVLTRVGAHMTGVVLNGVRTTVGGYLQKSYETFYEYQTKEG